MDAPAPARPVPLGQTETIRIATFNINGIKARLEALTRWLKADAPDVICLQEIKSVDEAFPREAVEAAGYNVETHGQKGFNGVAILSKRPLEIVRRGLPGDDGDEQARYIEALVPAGRGIVRVASIYLPNGNPLGSEKFPYKLRWLARLEAHARTLLALEEPLVLAGDYNIIPEPRDARRPEAWVNDALFQPESRAAWRRLTALGLTDALRAVTDRADAYTFWDYQAGAFQKNDGIRIDHLLLSPEAADRLKGVAIERALRAEEKPSDHVPVVATFAMPD
ncbi:exodeoxyribonuclease III [Pseudoxanthobacter sp.]|uniref:exodeoxyribonuclease III n=1 Tax=Pseudoxanthobacter sp. TaxID=1925742 RepID=UPI002FE0D167